MADNYDNLYSCTVVDEDGSRIGAVSQVYLDDATAEPTFVAARVGFFGNKEVLVPLVGAFISDDLMQVPHSADLVKQAPAPSPDRRLSPTQEAEASFEATPAFAWLQRNATRHRFHLSYPRDNPHGITYEPWHWRHAAAAG